MIVRSGTDGKTPDPHAGITGGNQPVGAGPRLGDCAPKHFLLPCRGRELRLAHAKGLELSSVQRIEDGLDIDLTGAERERLHRPARRLRFAQCAERIERGVERSHTAPVETPAAAARALAGQGLPGPLRTMRTLDQPPKPHQEGADSRITARHDAIKIGMHVIGPALAYQKVGRGPAEAGQRLGAKPGIGCEWRPDCRFNAVENFQHLAKTGPSLPRLHA